MPNVPNNFVINAADLAYILKQIQISEATSAGYTPGVAPVTILQAIMDAYGATAATAAQLPYGLRTVDGTFNNLLLAPSGTPGTPGYDPGSSEYGAADTLFPRLTDPVYYNDLDGDSMSFGPPGSGAPPPLTNTNYAGSGNVADADPRIISNLIVDMSVDNPAAIAAFFTNPLAVAAFEEAHPGKIPVAPSHPEAGTGPYLAITNEDLQTLPNLSPDIGLSPGFNAWMTYFGQFFDHGLDLVTKGNSGTVYIPLQNDDPLIAGADGIRGDDLSTTGVNEGADDLPAHLRFMALTRATQTLDENGVPQHENTTTSWIDQNQTYTSHSSHQVFLREYERIDVPGDGQGTITVSTGHLLDGSAASGSVDGAIANWGEIKAQAITMLGIKMNDYNVHDAPLLATDQYGKFLPGSNGYAQVAVQVQILNAQGTVIGTMGPQFFMNGVAGGLDLANLALPAGLPALPAGQSYRTASVGTGHAFLNDIAHHAGPAVVDHDHSAATPRIAQIADDDYGDANNDGILNADRNGDGTVSAAELVADDNNEATYDDEMLDAHFITGDGRGNENIALTSVHSIFHAEHNRTVEANKATILETAAGGDLTFLNEWLLVDVTSVPTDPSTLTWDGERLFQAARFSTEMQYQHLVFEEFARRIQPFVDPFVFNNSPNIDPSIFAEFAHTVYRFGHSMLTGTVDRLENDLTTVNGDLDQQSLLAVFLNPQAYVEGGDDLATINANIIRGLSRDVGNAMDEFIVTDVRSNLLGLPLDLGALNIARGRDTGVPSLNETRRQLYDDSGLADLKPYDNWADFAANMKNAASVVNFIAAYGTHETIEAATTLAGKRAAAEAIVFGGDGAPEDRLDFIYATGAYAGGDRGGLELIDLWIGGLAEASPEFGGMLGTTFNYVFEAQMENLQNGDRMYYLTRVQGQNLINQLEPNTFADLVMRNTDLGDLYSTHINGALFTTPDLFLELDRGIAQTDYNGSDPGRDPTWSDDEPHSPFDQKVTRTYTGVTVDGGHDVGGTMRYIGGQHVVMGGTEGNDRLYGDRGIDTLWGDGGDDYLNAGTESDDVFGGTGDDIIEDPFGDDILRGNEGNDVITSARGFDLMFGETGSDAIFIGQDAGEAFGGLGNDFILGGAGGDLVQGNEGDDWLEGGAGFDTLVGDNSELFFNSLIVGHDVMFAHADESDYDAESGDDIMGSGPSAFRYEGMFGFDWTIAKGDIAEVDFDLTKGIFTNVADDILRDRFDKVEAVSGYHFDDVLKGDNRGHVIEGAAVTGLTVDPTYFEDLLTQEGIDRIDGLGAWFGEGANGFDGTDARQTLFGGANPLVGGSEVVTSYRDGNILMGGDGNDVITGRQGYDLIDGDAYLNVRIGIHIATGPNAGYYSAESLNTDTSVAGPYAGRVYRMVGNDPQGDVNFAAGPAFGGRSISSLLLDRTITPGQMSIVREIKYDATNVDGISMNIDTAVFHGTLAEYDIEGRTVNANGVQLTRARDVNGDGFISVTDRDDGVTGATVNGVVLDSRRLLVDDTDLVKNIEVLRFADQTLSLVANRAPLLDLHAFDLVTTVTGQYLDNFNTQSFSNSNGTTPWNTSWVEANDGTNVASAGQIQMDVADSNALRFIAGDGASITRAVNLNPSQTTTLSYAYNFNQLDTDDFLRVEFAANGTNFVTVQTIAGATTNVNQGLTNASFSVVGTANSALRFTVSTLTGTEGVRIDNLSLTSGVVTQVAANDGTGFTSTFTENNAAVQLALNSSITDTDSPTILSAQIRLTNAQSLDVLSIAGALPAGITSSFGPLVAGEVTLILSGSASRAAYQTAIEAVRFANESEGPNVTQRVIEVTVFDGDGPSLTAIARVNVVSVNDAPVTVADAVVTNISSGIIVIPEWVLLANDSDPEGAVLDITAVSAAVGVTGLSLATNPGSVTMSDDGVAGGSFTYTASDGNAVNGTANRVVTMTNTGFAQVADNFDGPNNTTPSAANNSTGTTPWTSSWIELNDNNNIRTGEVQIDGGGGGGSNTLRFLNGNGASAQRAVDLTGVTAATLSVAYDKNNIDVGETLEVQFAADGINYVTLSTITNANNTVADGNAAGTLSLALTGALGANSTIRFVASAFNLSGEDVRINNVAITYGAANAAVSAGAGNQILVGNNAGSTFTGGAGDDTVLANGGDDTIIWSVGDGLDFIDGGANGALGDRFIVNGNGADEEFVVYARDEALDAGLTVNNAATEIVVTRDGEVIAELDNVEEITINTGDGDDAVTGIGDFGPTSLFFNTITVNGGRGHDTIDASLLTSAHHLVLNQGDLGIGASTFADMLNMVREPVETFEFGGIGRGAINAMVRKGLINSSHDVDMGWMGSRYHGAFAGSQFAEGNHTNPMFDRTLAVDIDPIDHVRDFALENNALHFDAADYLII